MTARTLLLAAVALSLPLPGTLALPALVPCASATNGASDRWGICTAAAAADAAESPLSLSGRPRKRLMPSYIATLERISQTRVVTA